MFSAIARAVSGRERREESVPLLPRDVEAGSDGVAGDARFGRSRGTIAGTGARDALDAGDGAAPRRLPRGVIALVSLLAVAGCAGYSASVSGGRDGAALGAAGTRLRPDRWSFHQRSRTSAFESVNPWRGRDAEGLKLATRRAAAPESRRGVVMAGQWPGSGGHAKKSKSRRDGDGDDDDAELVPVLGDQVVTGESTPRRDDENARRGAMTSARRSRPCVLKDAVTDEQAQAVLDFVCAPGGGVSCAPIGAGGARERPNTRRDHAAWAIDRYFRVRSREPDAFAQRDCHFVGVASLDAPNNFYVSVSGGQLVRVNPRVDTIANKVAVPREGVVFSSGPRAVRGTLVSRLGGSNRGSNGDPLRPEAGAATTFKFWAGSTARREPGEGPCVVETTVVYDFDGDGDADRTESFELVGVPREPDLAPVETKIIGHSAKARGARFPRQVAGARVSLLVRSPNCPGEVNVWESAAAYPSFLTVPYRE